MTLRTKFQQSLHLLKSYQERLARTSDVAEKDASSLEIAAPRTNEHRTNEQQLAVVAPPMPEEAPYTREQVPTSPIIDAISRDPLLAPRFKPGPLLVPPLQTVPLSGSLQNRNSSPILDTGDTTPADALSESCSRLRQPSCL